MQLHLPKNPHLRRQAFLFRFPIPLSSTPRFHRSMRDTRRLLLSSHTRRISLAHSRGAATQGDAHPCSHRFAARLRLGGYVPVRHADAARRRISLGRHLLQYVTGRAKASIIIKLRRFTKRLRYRCGRCFANFNHPFQTRDDRACRSRHEDAEGAQRAQCPNGSAPAVARPPRPCTIHAKTGAKCQTLRASYARSTDLNSATIFMSSPLAISMSR